MKQPETFGKFLLYGQVAVGGMAEIYKGRYADPNAPQADIAIKRILPSYTEDESFVTMFKDEGNIALRLQHPNIVRVYEVGEVNNDWYIAMEFIHGTDLRVLSDQCEKNNKRFTTTQVARVICETAKALDYAHACKDENGNNLNIVHRDCTPHNIMVTMDGQVKLMDFGIAKAASRATKTRVGTVKGKSSYMSPEQAKGQNLDGRSDMFTLGTVGWEMLTGHRLFKASSDRDAILKILKTPTVHPSELDANVPRELGDIIMLTLQKDRDMRYATCGQLANALEQYIAQHGDGSDQSLGIVVQALLNKNGHRVAELPDYVPGYSRYDVTENGDFNLKDSAPAPAPQPLPTPQQPMAAQPMMAPVSNATYPGMTYDPMAASALPQPKPWGLIIGSVLILLLGAIFIGGAFYFRSIEVTPNVTFNYPESRIKIKSKPDGATITINDQKLDGRTPHSHKAKLGETMEIKFELDGYEPMTIKREARLLDQTVSVDLMTVEDAQLAKMDAFKKLVIKTTPEDAKVKINGEDKGNAPVTLENVKFGTKLEIEVEADGYESLSRTIFATKDLESKNGETEQLLELAAAANKGGKQQPAKKADNAKPKPKKPAQAAATGSGTLTVKAKPWAIVSIDGARVGNTPISKKTLKAGSHKIELNHPAKQKKVNKTINLKNNQNLELNYDFNADKWL